MRPSTSTVVGPSPPHHFVVLLLATLAASGTTTTAHWAASPQRRTSGGGGHLLPPVQLLHQHSAASLQAILRQPPMPQRGVLGWGLDVASVLRGGSTSGRNMEPLAGDTLSSQ